MSSQVRLVTGLTFRELRRHAGAWRLPMVSSLLFAVIFIGAGSVTERLQDRAEIISFKVAVAGDVEGARAFLEDLANARLGLEEVDDAAIAVNTSHAAIGVHLPPRLDETLAAGAVPDLDVYIRDGHNTSREARSHLVQALDRMGTDADDPLTFVVEDVNNDPTANRIRFSQTLAAMVSFLCLGVVTAVASILGGARDNRVSEAVLVLPLRRTAVAAGTAAGAFPMILAQVGIGTLVLLAASMLPVATLGQSADAVADMIGPAMAGALLLALLAAAVGVLAGALGGGTDDAVGLGDLMATPFLALGVMLIVSPGLGNGPAASLVPGLGPLLLLRDGVGGGLDPISSGLAVATTALTAAFLVRVAAGRLAAESRVLRPVR